MSSNEESVSAVTRDEEPVEFEGDAEDAIRHLKNSRQVMHVDPNGYETELRATHVAYIWHEAEKFYTVTEYVMGTDVGVKPEHSVRKLVREHGCRFLDPTEVPDHV